MSAEWGADVVGLQEFAEYKVRVQARTAKGASGWSEPVRYTMSHFSHALVCTVHIGSETMTQSSQPEAQVHCSSARTSACLAFISAFLWKHIITTVKCLLVSSPCPKFPGCFRCQLMHCLQGADQEASCGRRV